MTKLPHLVAARSVEVDGRAPVRPVALREVGAELGQIVSGRAQVVVHHVDDHAEPGAVTGVHEAFETLRTAIGVVWGKQVDAVVAPPPIAREFGDRHHLDGVDSELDEVRQAARWPRRRCREG